ncbi:unnamed protein product [Protopolystoma xenopodis]|uniref:Uncharacterized protein n=1 Tax=Protopolystoma xenopodis TaxID=117903 RepID=A0A3S5AE37_9PLAT|nr:unnamed protein product [Protopolystoma xenopodis]
MSLSDWNIPPDRSILLPRNPIMGKFVSPSGPLLSPSTGANALSNRCDNITGVGSIAGSGNGGGGIEILHGRVYSAQTGGVRPQHNDFSLVTSPHAAVAFAGNHCILGELDKFL